MTYLQGGGFILGHNDNVTDECLAHRNGVASLRLDLFEVFNAEYSKFLIGVGGFGGKHCRRVYDVDYGNPRILVVAGRCRADPGFEKRPANEVGWFSTCDYWENAAPDAQLARFGVGWMLAMPAGPVAPGRDARGRREYSEH